MFGNSTIQRLLPICEAHQEENPQIRGRDLFRAARRHKRGRFWLHAETPEAETGADQRLRFVILNDSQTV